MNELIWFSVPGAIILFALSVVSPSDSQVLTPEKAAVLIFAMPIVGFILHQLWRTAFEIFWGYHSKKRLAINKIMRNYSLDKWDAFLLWELTFYSDAIPNSFREHDRGAWHYIMSFSSCALAAFISIAIILVNDYYQYLWIFIFLFLLVAFISKTLTTLKSLNRQEASIIDIYEDAFNNNSKKLHK